MKSYPVFILFCISGVKGWPANSQSTVFSNKRKVHYLGFHLKLKVCGFFFSTLSNKIGV
jgi:hypothetical protein